MTFPSSPSNEDLHAEFGRTFKYSSASNSWSSATPDAPEDTTPTTQGYVDTVSLPLTDVVAGSKAFVQEGNKLFIFTGNGWFEIATINTAPTITQGANATYELNADGTPTVITLQATDPEGTPIIWGYQVASGSLEDTTVTNIDNVFTVTPGNTAVTFNLTFTASDGVNIDTSASSFSLSFVADWTTNTTLHTLYNPNSYGTPTEDYFGESVAIDGNYVIVGAWYEDTATSTNSGAAYIFNATTGALLHSLTHPNPSIGTDSHMGVSVAIKGNYAVVGAYWPVSAQLGAAYVYNVTTGALVYTLTPPTIPGSSYDGAYSKFGYSVSISDSYIIVGAPEQHITAPHYREGVAHIYNLSDGSLLRTLLNPNANTTNRAEERFGFSVSIDGNYAVVSALFEDGTGSSGTNAGQAYIFNVATGVKLYNLNTSDIQSYSRFGHTVSISGDYCIVGAHRWAVGGNGGVGRVFVYSVSTGSKLYTFDNPTSSQQPVGEFGISVSTDGSYVFIGEHNRNRGHVYDLSDGSLINTIVNPNSYGTEGGDAFGRSVSISGGKAIVGAPLEHSASDNNTGVAYIFTAG